jgi:hypothetical protein
MSAGGYTIHVYVNPRAPQLEKSRGVARKPRIDVTTVVAVVTSTRRSRVGSRQSNTFDFLETDLVTELATVRNLRSN